MSDEPRRLRKFSDIVARGEALIPMLGEVTISRDGRSFQRLDEGKVVDGRFPANIRIDQPTHLHGQGSVHAHVYGRRGNELVVVNLDGTASHGAKGRLHPRDAEALAARGFVIPPSRIVECWVVDDFGPEVLLG